MRWNVSMTCCGRPARAGSRAAAQTKVWNGNRDPSRMRTALLPHSFISSAQLTLDAGTPGGDAALLQQAAKHRPCLQRPAAIASASGQPPRRPSNPCAAKTAGHAAVRGRDPTEGNGYCLRRWWPPDTKERRREESFPFGSGTVPGGLAYDMTAPAGASPRERLYPLFPFASPLFSHRPGGSSVRAGTATCSLCHRQESNGTDCVRSRAPGQCRRRPQDAASPSLRADPAQAARLQRRAACRR